MPQIREPSSDADMYRVRADQAGLRLSTFLGRVIHGLGVRGGKRLLAQGLVLVNAIFRPALYRVREGDVVAVLRAVSAHTESDILERAVRLVALTDSFAALYKPPGMHTVALAGKPGLSLEAALPRIWPSLCASNPVPPLLLSRLDKETSGLVAAAFTRETAERFRCMEAAGLVNKYYLALVRGKLTEPVRCAVELNTDSRYKVRILKKNVADATRHTLVTPMEDISIFSAHRSSPLTLVVVYIQRGARHQIRAHLAALGTPVVGDSLYGNDAPDSPLYLHHACFGLPGFTAFCPPPFFICNRVGDVPEKPSVTPCQQCASKNSLCCGYDFIDDVRSRNTLLLRKLLKKRIVTS